MKSYRLVNALLTVLALVTGLSSCNKRPAGVLKEKEMVDLLTDMQLAEAYYNTQSPGSERISRKELTDAVLRKHGVTSEELDSTLAYYGKNIDDYYLLYDKVEKNLRKTSASSSEEVTSNEADIWPYAKFAALLPGQTSDGITFSAPADGIEPGDRLEWKMRLSTMTEGMMMLGVEYANGTSTVNSRNITRGSDYQLTLQTDTGRIITRVFGILTVAEDSRPLWADSIRLVRTEFDSLTYSRNYSQRRLYRPALKPKEQPVDTLITVESNQL